MTTNNCGYKYLTLIVFAIHCCQQKGIAFSLTTAAGSNRKCIDCAIIGGGPAGLATSIAISNSSPSSSIAIFERDGFQRKGASIQISKSGWTSITDLDSNDGSLVTKLEETGVPVTAVEFKPWKSLEEDAVKITWSGRFRYGMKKALTKLKDISTQMLFRSILNRTHSWHDVRVVLRDHAEKLCSSNSKPLVNLNFNLENIQVLSPRNQDEARFELTFNNIENGTKRKVLTKYIFACDGTNSKVRSILPNEPDILLAEDKSVWRGMAPNISTSGKATFYKGMSNGNTAGRSALIFPGGKNAGSSWTVISDIQDGRANSDEESRRRVLKVIETMEMGSKNYKVFKKAIDDSPIIIENKLYVRDFEKPWESSYDGLIYIGDSAHPVRPTGEGTALAFKDANVLSQVISKHGLGVEALRQYENERYMPVKTISEKVRVNAQNYYKRVDAPVVGNINE